MYLWDWYFEISSGCERVRDGVVIPLRWLDIFAWQQLTREIVNPSEYGILRQMDAAFCAALAVEIANARAIAEDKARIGRRH